MNRDDLIALIIEQVHLDVLRVDPETPNAPGVDLGPYEPELRAMVHDAHTAYAEAVDDWEGRTKPYKSKSGLDDYTTKPKLYKPKKRLEANWPKPKKRLTANRKRDEEVAYDYGDDAGAGLDDWPEFWKWFYYRPPGRLGRSHTSDLPIAPLHAVYSVVRRWWIDTLGGKFNPTYPRAWDGDEGEVGGPRDIIEKFNPAGRLLLLIAREMDDRFTADNVANLRYTGYRRARRARHE